MKLVNKFILWFVAIILLTTPISMYITFHTIRQRIDRSETERLEQVNNEVAEQLKLGREPDKYSQGRPIHIEEIDTIGLSEVVHKASEKQTPEQESMVLLVSYYPIGDKVYKISSYNYVTKADQLFSGMLYAATVKLLLIVAILILTVTILSKYILHPFKETLSVIQNFDIRNKEPAMLFSKTSTKEFAELQSFVSSMIIRAKKEYASIKEFGENASHELQTPLAIIRNKLELLANTDIGIKQAELIADMQRAVETLSRINHSLLLLTKLENKEFPNSEQIDFSDRCETIIDTLEDGIYLNELRLEKHIEANVPVSIHPALADMLLNNLIGNAIKHNIEGGWVHIMLDQHSLCVRNAGVEPKVATHVLFHRFKKGNQSNEGIGLGLAIVKQICDLNGFDVSYHYQNGEHTVRILFYGSRGYKNEFPPEIRPDMENV
ncbi:sensor histidine kinase [Olivibacter sitiensis]|uniref:sensor histidine kinase n=1 Tax=Olivibacter sitiensis TaxID=376470 RepID=UPI000400A64F|nr:HAMP domain-containing sensor histidine kinase [Olivibacter sitiensis]